MQSINLNMIPGGVMPVINLTQFDEGRDFALVILNGAQAADLTGATLLISGKKNDDTAFSYGQSDTVKGNYVIAVNNNIVTIRNTLQMAAASGEVIATLTIKKSAADVSTLNFRIMVQEHPLDGVDISETEIPSIIALAQEQADEAEAWATGEIDGVPVPSTAPQYENSAEYWAQQAQLAVQGAVHFEGACTFAQIPTTGMKQGDMWNITDAFTTDSRFREGVGVPCKAGTNIAWDGTYWDVMATGSPLALPTGGIAGQFIVKQSSTDQDADWGSGIYHFANEAAAQAALSGGTIPNGATVLVDEIGGGTLQAPAISNLADVTITTIADGQILVYDNASGKWKNKNIDSAISTSSNNPVRNSTIAAALANGRISFGVDANGKFGYKKDGADTVYPFKSDPILQSKTVSGFSKNQQIVTPDTGYDGLSSVTVQPLEALCYYTQFQVSFPSGVYVKDNITISFTHPKPKFFIIMTEPLTREWEAYPFLVAYRQYNSDILSEVVAYDANMYFATNSYGEKGYDLIGTDIGPRYSHDMPMVRAINENSIIVRLLKPYDEDPFIFYMLSFC